MEKEDFEKIESHLAAGGRLSNPEYTCKRLIVACRRLMHQLENAENAYAALDLRSQDQVRKIKSLQDKLDKKG